MMRCCVAFCKNTTDNVTEPEHVTFHEFPADLHQRDAWLRALGKHDTVLPEPAVVCSQHFLYDDMYETNGGSRQICNGAIPCTVKVCIICFDTDSRMLLINKYNLEKSYENLTGHSLCVGGNLKPMLCVECAQRLFNFSRFRNKSLRARSLMLDLVTKHELISRRQIKSVNREKHQFKSNIVKTTLKPDHCNVFIQEHIGGGMKLYEVVTAENEEICTGMLVDEPNFVVVNEKTEHEDGEDDYSAVCKRDDISDESIMLAIRLVDEAAMTARFYIKEAQVGGLLKYENISCKCTVCFREFLNEEACNEHMMIHVKSDGECASDACQSQCEHPPALRTDTRAPHTHSSSRGSSLRTGHSRSSQKLSEGDSSADSTLTVVASLATNNEQQVHPTVADTIDINKQILTTDDDESHNKPSDTNNEPKHKRSRKAASKQNASLKIARETISSGNRNSQNKDTDSKHLNVPTTSSSVVITTDTIEPATGTVNELYVSKPVQSLQSTQAYTYSTVNSLHTQLGKHSLNKCFICDICHKTFKRKGTLVKHVRAHTDKKPFACSLCNSKCSQRSHLTSHIRTDAGEKPFACTLRDYKCSKDMDLTGHVRTHTVEKPYTCSLCNYKCSFRSTFARHMRTHTGEKPYTCCVCNYKCSESSDLTKHMRTHTGEKPYTCSLCNFKCCQRSGLTRHMLTHTDKKPYTCSLCNYKCSENSTLTMHIRIHTGEKPFTCSLCNYKYCRRSSLTRHMLTHTCENLYTCSLCNYKCNNKFNLTRHIRTHTGK